MPGLGTTELFIIAAVILLVAAWIHLFRQDGNPLILVIGVLVAYFFPLFGPLAVLLIYRPRHKRKRERRS